MRRAEFLLAASAQSSGEQNRTRPRLFFARIVSAGLLSTLPLQGTPGQADAQGGAVPTEARSVRIMDLSTLAAPMTVVFRYTSLVPGAAGQAEIAPGRPSLRIHATVAKLPPASQVRPGYLAYVLWAVTPEGRASNLGEIDMTGAEGQLNTKMVPSRFGLIITAEPYFAVSRPGKAVVFEADLAPGEAAVPLSQASCELLNSPAGTDPAGPDPPVASDPAAPSILEEGRRAIAVAKQAGAQQFAPETLATAAHLLQLASDQQARGLPRKDVVETGSEAVLVAEDARVLAVKRQRRAHENTAKTDPSH